MPTPPVTIVSGLPRSGTSMMMQMIDAGGIPALTDRVRQSDADNPRGYFEYEPVKRTRQDPSWLAEAPGHVVKMVHLLLLDLPGGYDYRVVMMRRPVEEVSASQRAMLERQGRPGAKLAPEALGRVFADQMARVQQALAARPNVAVLDVHYGEVVADPATQAARLSDFLGGLDTAAMAAAVDPSLYRQKKP